MTIHVALLGLAFSPAEPARFSDVPRAVTEAVRYTTLALGTSRNDRALSPFRTSRSTSRTRDVPRPPGPPRFKEIDLSFALNLVSTQPPLPELELPPMRDSLWGNGVGESPFGSSTRAPADRRRDRGAGWDSVTYVAAEVDRGAAPEALNPKPSYPVAMLYRGVEATFSVVFVVDTTGRIDTTTITLSPTVDPRFANAVRDVLGRWRFVPAEVRGKRVRQMLEQTFKFRIIGGQYVHTGRETNAASVGS